MASFKEILDIISKKKAPAPTKEFWARFDRELAGRLDAIDSRNPRRNYGFAERLSDAFSVFFQPKPVLLAATLVVLINLTLFSLAQRGPSLTLVAFLSNDDLAEELVLTDQLSSGEIIVDF